jgi:uncharacterized protein YdcH (DUF465 family)
MSKKRYKFGIIKGSRQAHIIDCHICKSATIDVYDDNIKYFVDKLNEQQSTIQSLKEENEQLKQELAELLAVHTKIVETLDSEFVSKALEDGD